MLLDRATMVEGPVKMPPEIKVQISPREEKDTIEGVNTIHKPRLSNLECL